MNKKQINKIIKELKEDNIFDNTDDIIKFLNKNYKDIKETLLYNSGGGIMIFYVNLNDSIYSISDEPLDNNNSNCIVYNFGGSIEEYLDYEEEWDRDLGRYCCYDDLIKNIIKI